MWIELFNGRDSFRAQESSLRRNVSVQLYTRVEDNGEGRKIVPLFQAFTSRLKGYGKNHLISRLAATEHFAQNDCGEWYKTRYEVAPGTEILIEYRHRSSKALFDEVEYCLIAVDENAPLYQMRIDLPYHFLASVHSVFFEGRFHIINKDKQLTPAAIRAWKQFLHLDGELSLVMDACQPPENRHFITMQLESGSVAKSSVEVTETEDGGQRVRIKRIRNIKVRK